MVSTVPLTVVAPVPVADLVSLYAHAGAIKPLHLKAALLQAARGASVGFLADGRLVAAAVLYPCEPERPGEHLAELAFVCMPAAARHVLAIVRHARLTAARLPDHVRIRAHCARDAVAGRRLAWMCGLRPRGKAGRFKRYEIEGRDGRIRSSGSGLARGSRRHRRHLQADAAEGSGPELERG